MTADERDERDEREERARARRDELETMLIREAVSIGALAVLMIALSPGVQRWLGHQWWRVRRWRQADAERAEAAVAGLRAELSRDLPLVEHGLVDP